MLNNITIMGRLTKDPELRTTQSGKAVATFTLAVDRDFDREKTDFFTCVAWNKTAEFVNKYFLKGQLAVIEGRMESREWTDKQNNKRLSWEVQVGNVYFGESKKADIPAPEFREVEDDGDLPF